MTLEQKSKIVIRINPRAPPVSWINGIFANLDSKSAGPITKHLMASTLRELHPSLDVKDESNTSGHVQLKISNLLSIRSLAYHISVKPTRAVIKECKRSLSSERQTVLFVPNASVERTVVLAQKSRINNRIMVFGIENYISLSIIFMSCDQKLEPLECLGVILRDYNHQVEAIEAAPFLEVGLQET